MTSLVSEFIINPVLRQARRFSEISRTTLAGDDHDRSAPIDAEAASVPSTAQDTVVEEPKTSTSDADSVMTPDTPHSRSVSASIEETRFETVAESPSTTDETSPDRLAFSLSPRRGRAIPEDDGMHAMRKRIQAVSALGVSPEDKARQIHGILLEGYRSSHLAATRSIHTPPLIDEEIPGLAWEPSSSPGPLGSFKSWYNQSVAAEKYMLSASDIAPTFAPIRSRKGSDDNLQSRATSPSPELHPPLGCQHYERNVKLQCFTCKKWYTCRFCHDAQEDHALVRTETRNMLCMLCGTPQKASEMCINCGEISAHYYCSICKLWENRKTKPIYHCNDCGICRRGLGLGKDFFHCKTCRACITTSIQSSHKCIERSTDCDCPICGDYMFTSPKPVVFMPCGHSIHKRCYDQHMRVSYKCPICNRSLANMESQFRNLDVAILSQPMPPEFRDTRATVLCNDCSGKCVVRYHWLGLKCSICQSYNTVELQIHGNGNPELQTAAERAELALNAQTQQQQQIESSQRDAVTSPAIAIVAGTSGTGTWIPNRRRHSSHGVELQHRAPDRLARSLTPLETAIEVAMGQGAAAVDVDSDDDIFGFWRGYRSHEDDGNQDDEGDEDLSDEDFNDDADDSDDAQGADDDDDEDDILLIGHR
ncbi:uncharacterized protein CPUR_06675 [Claviceps purpurea 20.1]|uniref:Zn-finger protein n=1 Tax=Claviceps purpurea (strain 20.1) TaxID=1111077 RepID=M1WA29_CLAP2|nr:hypothetical protein E4U12_003477 [Claviceps purpurea]CCE32810.1 uncharacterized protein CPUR_06675 [Claviceps purpurea 20.1]KAG6161777.1 hypothetical protein E4U11_003175 [Claviceps purpurea]KAG6218229.1 hypothetical protein E4U50_001684 [Claviceps purpurea]KAG6256081.1 hypothetical protein E4U23_002877 [Claviceps purpurea]